MYIPFAQRRLIKDTGRFDDLSRHHAHRVYPEHLPSAQGPSRHVVSTRLTNPDHGVQAVLDGEQLSYAMWRGRLRDLYAKGIIRMLAKCGVQWEAIYTSGQRFGP